MISNNLSPPADFREVTLSYIFHLDKKSAVELKDILSCFLSGKTTLGLIILVDKNSFVLKELTFLGDLPYQFFRIKKPFGLWGLPYCVMQFILGGYDYSRYVDSLIAESPQFSVVRQSRMHSSLLLSCHKCIAVGQCSGVGNLVVNHSVFSWRVRNSERLKRSTSIILRSSINKHYHAFLEHITSFLLEKTDRSIRFASVFLPKNEPVYRGRFIYYCNYLAAGEFEAEKAFILSISENRDFVLEFFQYCRDYFRRFAFSLAAGTKKRETFYGFFISDRASRDFLGHFGMSAEQEGFEEPFHFFGMDFVDHTMTGYKLYAEIHDETRFFDYLQEALSFDFPAEMRAITHSYLLVRRIDSSGRLRSLKIEFLCRDFPRLILLTERYFAVRLELSSHSRAERIAFDITSGGAVNKSTVYSTLEQGI